MSHWDFGRPPAGHHDTDPPYGTGDYGTGDDAFPGDDGTSRYPITWEREPSGAAPPWPDGYPPDGGGPGPWPGAPYPGGWHRGAAGDGGEQAAGQAPPWAGDSSAGRYPGGGLPGRLPWASRAARPRPARPRWLAPAAVVLAAGTAAGITAMVLAGGGRPAAPAAPGTPAATVPARSAPPPSAAAPTPLSMARARAIVAAYTAANNSANARRSGTLLATVETGSSYAIDTGMYRLQRAAGAAPYPAFGPSRAVYYIPRAEPAGGPRWFAVRVSNAFLSDPGKVVSAEYLLFTQDAAGGPWRNALEPYLMRGAAAPQVAVGPDGLATAVGQAAGNGGAAGARPLAVAPGQIAGVTAASLDGAPDGAGALADPAGAAAGLADRIDQGFWRSRLPAAAITDRHAAVPGGPVFGLLTTDGGALLFYADAARLTLAPPAGSLLRLTVPGFYAPATALRRAALSYADQLAAYDPPAGSGSPRVIASYSGITGKS